MKNVTPMLLYWVTEEMGLGASFAYTRKVLEAAGRPVGQAARRVSSPARSSTEAGSAVLALGPW